LTRAARWQRSRPAPSPPAALAIFRELPGRLTAFDGDVRDRALLERILRSQGIDRVLQGAVITAATRREMETPEEILSVNLGGLASVVTMAAAAGIRRLVSIGSIAVYGTAPADGQLLEEDHPHSPANLYGITKSTGEALVTRLGELHGLDCVIARIGSVFGSYEYDTGVRDTLSPAFHVTRLALGRQPIALPRLAAKNYLYARDAAASLIALLDAPVLRHRIYNLGSSEVWTIADWCALLAERLPGVEWSVGHGSREAVGLWNPSDGGLLSWQRYGEEFGPAARFGLHRAFDDYMAFIADPRNAFFRPA
jgi:nucleoside-diphosphate-sugar epimerase